MTACPRCGARVRRDETECWTCQSPLVDPHAPKNAWLNKFRLVLDVLFFASLGMTVARLFTDQVPPFGASLAASVILRLVRSSATQMSENQS